jgi:RNA polymerase sigma factor (sigma-70 family)
MLDPLLQHLVDAAEPDEGERRLSALIEEQALPLVRRIAAHKLRAYGGEGRRGSAPEDVEEVTADAVLALVSKLQALRADPAAHAIANFGHYAATVTFNTFAHYLRRRYPERSRLKNRLRHALGRDPRLGLWPAPEGWACGLAAWRPQAASGAATAKLERVAAEPDRWLPWTGKRSAPPRDPVGLVGAVLDVVGGPVEFDRLVSAMATLSGTGAPEPRRDAADVASLPDAAEPADLTLDRRRYTERLWREIGALPPRQRVALLLNLRDPQGRGLLWVLPLTGVASIRQIARTLEMPDAELAEMWGRLPVDDREIAARLGCPRQQVINLRASARKRLAHRLAERVPARPEGAGNMPVVSASLKGGE